MSRPVREEIADEDLAPPPLKWLTTITRRRFYQGRRRAGIALNWILRHQQKNGDADLEGFIPFVFEHTRFAERRERKLLQAAFLMGIARGIQEWMDIINFDMFNQRWQRSLLRRSMFRLLVAAQQLLTQIWSHLRNKELAAITHLWAHRRNGPIDILWHTGCIGARKAATVAEAFPMIPGNWTCGLPTFRHDQFFALDLIVEGKARVSDEEVVVILLVQIKSGKRDGAWVVHNDTALHDLNLDENDRRRLLGLWDLADEFRTRDKDCMPIVVTVGETPMVTRRDGSSYKMSVYSVRARAQLLKAAIQAAFKKKPN